MTLDSRLLRCVHSNKTFSQKDTLETCCTDNFESFSKTCQFLSQNKASNNQTSTSASRQQQHRLCSLLLIVVSLATARLVLPPLLVLAIPLIQLPLLLGLALIQHFFLLATLDIHNATGWNSTTRQSLLKLAILAHDCVLLQIFWLQSFSHGIICSLRTRLQLVEKVRKQLRQQVDKQAS